MHAAALFCPGWRTTTEVYPLSLHVALPIWSCTTTAGTPSGRAASTAVAPEPTAAEACPCPSVCSPLMATNSEPGSARSEEHTSELQSQSKLVCRLLLE